MDLFGRAKKAVRGWSPPPPAKPQNFRVLCVEGHPIEGRRTESYQAIRCPECGEGVFVLPISPLPDPKPPENRANRAPRPSRQDDSPIPLSDPIPIEEELVAVEDATDDGPVEEIRWEDEDDSPAPAARSERNEPGARAPEEPAPIAAFDPDLHLEESEIDQPAPAPRAARAAAGNESKRAQAPNPEPSRPRRTAKPEPAPQRGRVARESPPMVVAEPEAPRPSFRERLWRNRNPLIALAVVLAVSSAVGVRLWREKLLELPKIYAKGKDEGLAALDRGDFALAKELLREAARAARLLGGDFDDDKLSAVLHGAEEAAIFADLASSTLEEIVEKRARAKSPEEWRSDFEASYRGQSIILITHVTAVPDPARPGSYYDTDYRIAYGGGQVPAGRGRVALDGFQLVESTRPKIGDLLAFGARIESVDLDDGTGEWVIRLEPSSGVFIQHTDALRAVAGVADDAEEEPRR
ncbi:MAG: hypothetical protein SFX72_05280 [Isosphaeraceae bacterium]|nr:hypothetical protein [Isosphaeraceae bacterium]